MFTRTTALALLAVTATSAALAACSPHAPAATPTQDHQDSGYAITVDGSQGFPESVAADDHYVYTTSIADGTVYRAGAPGRRRWSPSCRAARMAVPAPPGSRSPAIACWSRGS